MDTSSELDVFARAHCQALPGFFANQTAICDTSVILRNPKRLITSTIRTLSSNIETFRWVHSQHNTIAY